MKKIFLLAIIIALSIAAISQLSIFKNTEEHDKILFIREEEKLARDVYESLYEKWHSNPFGNIRHSEQVHMDRMKELANNYKLNDPVSQTKDVNGKFVNIEIQKLYNQLVSKGSTSFEEALQVGAYIEELDISDIQKAIAVTKNSAVLETYAFLKWGSENHLNAFTQQLKSAGVVYKPVVLSQSEFDHIIVNDHRGQHNGMSNCKGKGKCCDK